MLDHNPFDLLVLDLMMPQVDGIGVIDHLAASRQPTPPVIIMTAAVPDILHRLPDNYPGRIITKPFDLSKLVQYADEAIRGSHAAA